MSILYGKHHCQRCGTAIDPDTFRSCEMIQWPDDSMFCEGDHCYLQTEDGKREIQDGDVTEEALENADDYDRRLREKALEGINKKLSDKQEYLTLLHRNDRLAVYEKVIETQNQIAELREQKKKLAKEV